MAREKIVAVVVPSPDIRLDAAADALWQQCLTLRGEITRVLEIARQNKAIGLSLDAEVVLQAGPEWRQLIADTPGMLAARDRFLSAGWYEPKPMDPNSRYGKRRANF